MLMQLIHATHPHVSRRVRSILLRKLGKSSHDVHVEMEISRRQVFRWWLWYRSRGLRGLLREHAHEFRQCFKCHRLGAAASYFSPTNYLCRPCNAQRVREYRSTERGRAAHSAYVRSPNHYAAVRRYEQSDEGRTMKHRQYERQQLRLFRAGL